MRKKWKLFGLCAAAAAMLLSGCGFGGRETDAEPGYTVYYVNAAGTGLTESNYMPEAETFEEMMDELILQMSIAPSGSASALGSHVKISGYERGIDALRIDFTDDYYDLSNTQEVLLRAAVVKTFAQIPGVTKIMITVEKEQLRDSDGELVPPMDGDTFIDTREGGINSYQYAKLSLYFANSGGKELEKEMRNLHYSSNMVLERMVVEQLIKGPKTKGMKAVIAGTAKIQNIYTSDDGICTISFDEEFLKDPSENPADPKTAIYAIVNSVCETCDSIKGVRMEVDGEGAVTFRGAVDLNQTFLPDSAFIEQEEEMQTEPAALMQETEDQAAAQPDPVQAGERIEGTVVGVDASLAEE